MEEVVGSIPTRSTKLLNHLGPKSGNNNRVGTAGRAQRLVLDKKSELG